MIKQKNITWLFFICLCFYTGCKTKETATQKDAAPVKIRLGHVGHDHHLALFTAFDNAADYATQTGISLKEIEKHRFYELYENGKRTADIEIIKVGGGSKMPTALAQDVIEVGFGGVAPVLAAIDKGAPIKLISPLHYKGDMFVVRNTLPVETWQGFVNYAKNTDRPIRIGYKSPVAVAKIIFEEALTHHGITFSGDISNTDVKIHMINVKGGGKLNISLASGLIDGYAGNNPFPAIAVDTKSGRIVCDLEDLPPGTFRDHPCCCIAAAEKALENKREPVIDLLVLFKMATDTINNDLDKAVLSAINWIGTSESVERMSIPTSGYSMDDTQHWHDTMNIWTTAMNRLDVFENKFKNTGYEDISATAYDFSLLNEAKEKLAQTTTKK